MYLLFIVFNNSAPQNKNAVCIWNIVDTTINIKFLVNPLFYTKRLYVQMLDIVYKYYMVWGEAVKTIFPEVLATGLPPRTRRVRGGRPVASTEGK